MKDTPGCILPPDRVRPLKSTPVMLAPVLDIPGKAVACGSDVVRLDTGAYAGCYKGDVNTGFFDQFIRGISDDPDGTQICVNDTAYTLQNHVFVPNAPVV